MITVTITRNNNNKILSFAVQGHANYAEYGKDIVCAGVSAVTIGTVNAIHKLTEDPCDVANQDGYLFFLLHHPNQMQVTTETILNAMIVMLQSIIEAHPYYVELKEVKHAY